MAEICSGVVSESETTLQCESSSRTARRRRMEIRRFKFVGTDEESEMKRQKREVSPETISRECENAVESCVSLAENNPFVLEGGKLGKNEISVSIPPISSLSPSPSTFQVDSSPLNEYPKFGVASVCGRRRDMEDAVAVHPSFCREWRDSNTELHYFGVYDGHGCSHVAMKCRDRLHELVKVELESREAPSEWKDLMERSFARMDKEVIVGNEVALGAACRCELQTPDCDTVGSTAVVAIVTPDKIIVANCGDSRAVLCRNGKAVPLSTDHKPDRPDELNRIQAAGGRVIFWEGARVLGVLAMSRAIGDNYLKPYVCCEPEVTVTDRTSTDECLILASDGLWDVVSNETACGVARMCLRGNSSPSSSQESPLSSSSSGATDKACSDASMLLMKLALARRSTDNVSVVVIDLRGDT